MVRDRRKIQKALQQKGFKRSDNDHAKFSYFSLTGIKTSVWTKTSYGSKHKDLSDSNISSMARQCRLSNREFNDLIHCPLTRDNYEALLITRKQIVLKGDKLQ